MIRHFLYFLAIIIFGLLIGGSLRHFVSDSDAEEATPTEGGSPQVDVTPQNLDSSESDHLPRPTFEEVMQIRGMSESPVLLRYLEDATLEETIALMEAFTQETRFSDMMWMVQMRGLELAPEKMLAWAKNMNSYVLYLLFRTWAAIDPSAALEASLNEPSRMRQTVISMLREGNLDEALAVIKAVIPDAPELREFENLKWVELAAEDVHAALAGVVAIEDSRERRKNLSAVLELWVKKDALAAVRWIEKQQGLSDKNLHYRIGIQTLAETQPLLARSEVETLPLSRSRSDLELIVADKWAANDPNAALDWVKSLPKGPRRADLFASVAGYLKLDPEEMFNLAKELGDGSNRGSRRSSNEMVQTLRRAAIELANESPQKAFEAVYNQMGGDTMSVGPIAESWVGRDPEEAANWVAGLPGSEFSQTVQQAVFKAWIDESVEASAAFLADHEISDKKNLSLMVAKEWVTSDVDAAVAWVGQLEEGVQEDVLPGTLTEVARIDPVLALEYVNHVEDTGTQQAILSTAAQTWRKTDPEGTMGWLQSQPTDAAIDGILKDTAKAWVLSQPQAASEWIQSMEAGVRRDHAVAGMVHALISSTNPTKDFEAAESWVSEINDLEIQQQWIDEINKRRP